MKGGGRRFSGMPLNGRKDRDEDLLLFKELHKREKDRHASLLQPVSDEFEPNMGNHALYRIASGKKGSSGYEFFCENDKNDYDWLKTPPATPLFPSLEMEANALQQQVMQREIPIIQPLSRFADSMEALKGITGKPKSPNINAYRIPQRSLTPTQGSGISSSTETKAPKATTPTENQDKMAPFKTSHVKRIDVATNTETQKQAQKDLEGSYLSGDMNKKTRGRGVSPSVRSTIPAQIPGFSHDTPPNLRTDRATSATRGRPAANPCISNTQKPDPTSIPRRQSCSPSVTRGRKETTSANSTTQKGKVSSGNNFGQIFGSRMVDKVMNARKLGAEERETKAKLQATPNSYGSTTTGFGRMMPKSSPDMAFKHLEVKRGQINSRHPSGPVSRRSTTS